MGGAMLSISDWASGSIGVWNEEEGFYDTCPRPLQQSLSVAPGLIACRCILARLLRAAQGPQEGRRKGPPSWTNVKALFDETFTAADDPAFAMLLVFTDI